MIMAKYLYSNMENVHYKGKGKMQLNIVMLHFEF